MEKIKTQKKPILITIVVLLLLLGLVLICTSFASQPATMKIGMWYCQQSDENLVIVGVDGTEKDYLLLPEELNGIQVIGVAGNAFKDSRVTNFIVPKSVTKFGSTAFDSRLKEDFHIFLIGRTDLSGLTLSDSWNGSGIIIYGGANPYIDILFGGNSPPSDDDIQDLLDQLANPSLNPDGLDNSTGYNPNGNDENSNKEDESNSSPPFSNSGTGGKEGEHTTIDGTVDGNTPSGNKVFQHIEIVTPPNKLQYVEGTRFNPQGMVIKAVYSDKTSVILSNYAYSTEPLVKGQIDVTISYEDKGKEYSVKQAITVVAKTPTSIKVLTPPEKTKYTEGETFDSDGLRTTVSYDNGTTAQVTPSFENSKLVLGQGAVVLSYKENGKTVKVEQPISVIKKVPTKIKITTPPRKTAYIENTVFDKTGMVVTATYNNGDTAVVTGYTYPTDKLTYGTTKAEIVYTENGAAVKTNQAITVKKKTPISLAITTPPAKTEYIENTVFDKTGIVVTATYNNGETAVVTGYTYPTGKLTYGTTKVEISYTENGAAVKTNQAITVKKKTPISLAITTPPAKTEYIENTVFDKTGIVVTATYDNGETAVVTGYTYPTGKLTYGATKVEISYTENGAAVKTTQAITVKKKTPVSLAVTTPPTKTAYIEEQLFDSAGMVVTVTYDNGEAAIVTGYTYLRNPLTAGQSYITLGYEENGEIVSCNQSISVRLKKPKSLKITSPPSTTAYIERQLFNRVGLQTEVTYDNDTKEMVTAAYPNNELVYGQTAITLTYEKNGGKATVSQAITVRKKSPTKIAVTKQPTKTNYSAGLKFKNAGMIVTATYDNGKSAVVTGYTYPNVRLAEGQSKVELTYTENGKTVKTNVTVTVGPQLAVYEKYTTKLDVSYEWKNAHPSLNMFEKNYSSTSARFNSEDWSGSGLRALGELSYIDIDPKTGQMTYDKTKISNKASDYSYTAYRVSDCGRWIAYYRRSYIGVPGSPDGYYQTSPTSYYCIDDTKAAYKKEIEVEVKGTYISDITVTANSLPENGKHTDGNWYVFKNLIQD